MPNLKPNAAFDKPSIASREYVRAFLAETAWGIGITTEILDRYLALGQDEMALHSVRQIVAMTKALREAARRLYELKREEEAG